MVIMYKCGQKQVKLKEYIYNYLKKVVKHMVNQQKLMKKI